LLFRVLDVGACRVPAVSRWIAAHHSLHISFVSLTGNWEKSFVIIRVIAFSNFRVSFNRNWDSVRGKPVC